MAQVMTIAVLFFGKVADRVGERQRTLELSEGGQTLFAVRADLLGPLFDSGALEPAAVQTSLNQVRISDDRALSDGDEVAFFSTFSGG